MSNQNRKQILGLSGEFLAAGELLRRGINATVTYGNAKKADIVVFNEGKAITLEVKTTSRNKWVIGGLLPHPSNDIWIFVYLPEDEKLAPEYFILDASELNSLLLPSDERYKDSYRTKHNQEFAGKGVVSIERVLLGEYSGNWQKVKIALGL